MAADISSSSSSISSHALAASRQKEILHKIYSRPLESSGGIGNLPYEIQANIFFFCDPSSIHICARIDKLSCVILRNHQELWAHLVGVYYGKRPARDAQGGLKDTANELYAKVRTYYYCALEKYQSFGTEFLAEFQSNSADGPVSSVKRYSDLALYILGMKELPLREIKNLDVLADLYEKLQTIDVTLMHFHFGLAMQKVHFRLFTAILSNSEVQKILMIEEILVMYENFVAFNTKPEVIDYWTQHLERVVPFYQHIVGLWCAIGGDIILANEGRKELSAQNRSHYLSWMQVTALQAWKNVFIDEARDVWRHEFISIIAPILLPMIEGVHIEDLRSYITYAATYNKELLLSIITHPHVQAAPHNFYNSLDCCYGVLSQSMDPKSDSTLKLVDLLLPDILAMSRSDRVITTFFAYALIYLALADKEKLFNDVVDKLSTIDISEENEMYEDEIENVGNHILGLFETESPYFERINALPFIRKCTDIRYCLEIAIKKGADLWIFYFISLAMGGVHTDRGISNKYVRKAVFRALVYLLSKGRFDLIAPLGQFFSTMHQSMPLRRVIALGMEQVALQRFPKPLYCEWDVAQNQELVMRQLKVRVINPSLSMRMNKSLAAIVYPRLRRGPHATPHMRIGMGQVNRLTSPGFIPFSFTTPGFGGGVAPLALTPPAIRAKL